MTSASEAPPRLLVRSKDGVELFSVSSRDNVKEKERSWLLKGATTLQVMSPDGSRAYFHKPSVGIVMCPLDGDGESVSPFLKDSQGVQMLATSPKGSYLVTWERQQENQPNNLKVWNATTGEFLHGFVQKNLKRDGWPYLHWTHDETYAFLQVTNEIRVYQGDVFSKCSGDEQVRFVDKMRCPGMTSMSVPTRATTASYLLTTFVPNSKDRPARVSLHTYPSKVPSNATTYPALLSKSLYQADDVTVHWSPKGDAALTALQTSVDTSGESYYGSTTLFLLDEVASDVVSVPLPNNSTGPVLDVSWMPNPTKPPCFAVISGRMPAMASLHHGSTAEPLFLFGNAHRNTIAWSEHGRFVCLAGFGNLAGGMTFWDRNKQKPIPQYDPATGVPSQPEVKASCTVGYGWSPDSRMFVVSTTSPRMNVDNGIRLFRYNGEEVTTVPWDNSNYKPDRLLEATFVPVPEGMYPDRPQSPAPRPADPETAAAVAQAKEKLAAAKPTVAPSAGRYVPPSARGKSSGGNSLAERLRREKEGNMMGATKVTPKSSVPGMASKKGTVVGLVPVETKSKSALKKERQRAAKAKAEAEAAQKKAEEAAAASSSAADPAKRAKKIYKLLKQIDELKAKDPGELNDDQKDKISKESSLREELATLKV
jgi:translation initiation factor 2A